MLPPGLFVTLAVFLFLWYRRRLFLALATFIWLLSAHPVGDLLIKPLEHWHYKSPSIQPQAVVVLGGGEVKEAPNLPLSASGTKRLLYGLMLANQKRLPLVVSGCEGKNARKSLQEMIQAFGLSFRECSVFKPYCFLIEDKSKDTYQNAYFSAKIAPKSIYLVTSAYHMPRSYLLFSHFGFSIIPAPTDYKSGKGYELINFLPSYGGFEKVYLALHEYLGLLSLYIRGIV